MKDHEGYRDAKPGIRVELQTQAEGKQVEIQEARKQRRALQLRVAGKLLLIFLGTGLLIRILTGVFGDVVTLLFLLVILVRMIARPLFGLRMTALEKAFFAVISGGGRNEEKLLSSETQRVRVLTEEKEQMEGTIAELEAPVGERTSQQKNG